MDEFELNELRRIAVNAMDTKDKYNDRTGKHDVSKLGTIIIKLIEIIEKRGLYGIS